MEAETTRRGEAHLERMVAAACALVGSDKRARTVTLVLGRRPTYNAMVCFREHAAAWGVDLAVDGDGAVTVYPRVTVRERAASPAARRSQPWRERFRARLAGGGSRPTDAAVHVESGRTG